MTLDELRAHLQTAVEIEWAVIPPYLCATWSLADGRNELAATCIDEVVIEEMLHLTLACNLLNAVGGEPQLMGRLPRYPTFLPHSGDDFRIDLRPFSPEALETFLRIERPARRGAPSEPGRYQTIGQFYDAILEAIEALAAKQDIFTGDPGRQIDGSYYYAAGGEAFPVTDLESAKRALDEIVFEGEGMDHTIYEQLGEGRELAHYFRFDELYRGRRYVAGDTPTSGPTGDPILLDYGAVLPMRPNPRAADHPPGSELRAMTDECNRTYSELLRQLDAAFNGRPEELVASVQTMLRLRYQAIALMRVPVGDGLTAGPAFEWSGG